MKEKKNNDERDIKKEFIGVIKGFFKRTLIIPCIVVLAVISLLAVIYYYLKGDDFKTTSETAQTYSTTVNNQGKIEYTKNKEESKVDNTTNQVDGTTTKLTPSEMAEEYKKVLQKYISKDDKEYRETMEYLMGAETVTAMPYFDTLSEGELNGRIKFYRYTDSEDEVNGQDVTEENRLKFKPLEEFNAKLQAYKTNASENRDIFNYFTMDEEGAVLVAYGSEEYRNIDTGVDGSSKDKDLTVEAIKEVSTFTENYKGDYNTGFSAVEFNIFTKAIDYRSLVEQYTMPATLLYAFLIQTENVEYVKALAKLAYESEIAIGIFDNKTYSETNEIYTYKKLINMKVETEIAYTDPIVEITNIGPKFEFNYDNLYWDRYENILKECEILTKSDTGTVMHQNVYINEGEQGWVEHKDKKMYISGTDNNNKITSLGEGETYKTKYKKTKETMSTPTVGVLLADTWIAKWEATYTKENIDTPGTDISETIEDKEIKNYGNNILDAFKERGSLLQQESIHAQNQISNIINKIKDQAKQKQIFTVSPTQARLTRSDKVSIMKDHIDYCYKNGNGGCLDYILTQTNVITDEALRRMVIDIENEEYYCAEYEDVLDDRLRDLDDRARQDAKEQTKQREKEFERQINLADRISYRAIFSGSKLYTKTSYNSSSSSISSRYNKSEQIQRTEDGQKFSEVFNRKEFNSVRKIFSEIGSWFWEYVESDEDTNKIENILRYLLNIATNPEYLKNLTDEEKAEIEELFSLFEPKEEMTQVSSDSSIKLLQKYVRMYENSYIFDYVYGISDDYTNLVSKYITQDRTAYYVRTDGYDNPTVGFGVDLFQGGFEDEGFKGEISPAKYLIEYYGYTEEQLKDVSGKTTISAEIVDELELKELQKHIDDKIKMNKQENLGLTKYQIYALVSLGFNTGDMYKWGDFSDFIQLFKENWNEENDSKYGKNESNEAHIMYTDFFYKYRRTRDENGNLVESPGLIKRRESEWKLFQTGYMDTLGKWISEQEYPEGIRLFTMDGTGLTFPEYPQDNRGGEQYVLYKDKGMGGKTYEQYGRTLETSGCGVFAASCIVSGLLGDASIDPISYVENLDEHFPNGDYYYYKPHSENNGGNGNIWNNKFLEKYYGLNSIGCSSEEQMKKFFEQKQGNCGAIINEGGHYVAIIPIINKNGKCESFYAIDSVAQNTGEYTSASEYISENHRKNARFSIMGIIY